MSNAMKCQKAHYKVSEWFSTDENAYQYNHIEFCQVRRDQNAYLVEPVPKAHKQEKMKSYYLKDTTWLYIWTTFITNLATWSSPILSASSVANV